MVLILKKYFYKIKKIEFNQSSYTNSKRTIKASSPILSFNLIILVYPPFLSAYLVAYSSNNFLTKSLSLFKKASAFLLETKSPF